jgi:hypothetical protein
MFVDRNPASSFVLAQAHGRMDMVDCTAKALLAVVAAIASSPNATTTSASALVVCVGCVGLMQLYIAAVYQPLFSRHWNQCRGGMAAVVLWASACAGLAHFRAMPDDEVGDHWHLNCPCAKYCCSSCASIYWLGMQ